MLKYASKEGSAWTLETVGGRGVNPTSISLALDSRGYPSISYAAVGGYSVTDLQYTWFDGSSWQSVVVERGGMLGDYNSMVLDSLDHPHISYCAVDPATGICATLKYAYQDNGSWIIETVDDKGSAGAFSSLRMDAAGDPHISYCLSGQLDCAELRYAWQKDGAWHTEKVAGAAGNWSSLTLDRNGQPHVSYSSSGALKYAYRIQSVLPATGQPSVGRPVIIAAMALLGLGLVLRYLARKRARRDQTDYFL